MRIVEKVEFDAEDYKLMDALRQGYMIDVTGKPKEFIDLMRILCALFSCIDDIEDSMEWAVKLVHQVPLELQQRYLRDFITKYGIVGSD